MAHALSLAGPTRLRERLRERPRRVQTVLAPALPALVLLAVTTAGTVDPPRAGLEAQLHVPPATQTSVTPAEPGFAITPR